MWELDREAGKMDFIKVLFKAWYESLTFVKNKIKEETNKQRTTILFNVANYQFNLQSYYWRKNWSSSYELPGIAGYE